MQEYAVSANGMMRRPGIIQELSVIPGKEQETALFRHIPALRPPRNNGNYTAVLHTDGNHPAFLLLLFHVFYNFLQESQKVPFLALSAVSTLGHSLALSGMLTVGSS